jgi:hypothetical protein
VAAAAAFVTIGALLVFPIVLPLISIIAMPLLVVLTLPLRLLKPPEDGANDSEIEWCRNCKHYRKSREYEDIQSGLYQSTSMPRSDKLPCNIPLETAEVWQLFYATELGSRTLFPKDCASFNDQHTRSGSSKSR